MTETSPFSRMRRLHERGPRSRGLVVDRDGVALGPAIALLRRSEAGYVCLSPDILMRVARMAFGDDVWLEKLPTILAKIAKALDAGDLVKGQLLGLEIPISELDHDQLARLAAAADLHKSGFDPSQPRDERGRWTGDGGVGTSDAMAAASVQIADASDSVSDAGGILPAAASDGGRGSSPAPVRPPPAPTGKGKVREYSPEDAAKLPTPPSGSKYVTLSDGAVLWSAYSNHGKGAPMLMPEDVSLAENARLGESLRGYDDLPTEPDQMDPKNAAMISLFAPHFGTMDYQRKYGTGGDINRDYIDVGNYNYGVVAAAAGYSWEEATVASGLANLIGSGDKSGPWWNNPRNLEMIKKGYNDYKAGRIISLGN